RDHTDCYHSDGEIRDAFLQFACNAKERVICADDPHMNGFPQSVTFGNSGRYRMTNLRVKDERYSFTVTEDGIPLEKISLNVRGRVHAEDALAAFAAARLLGISVEDIKTGLERFRGVKRRFERVGTIKGVPVVCDYAHHPREIAATFETARAIAGGVVRVVFQPHTYTRTRDLMEEFVGVLKQAENPIVFSTYAAREPFDLRGSAAMLVSRVPEASYAHTPEEVRRRLIADGLKEGDLVLVLGAGDIYDTIKTVLDD
ncbi:MAG: hypothetical protein K2L87_02960, partial [Clostridiales bacterium]|nr:hypothetical protein [Clostridiales bacterium]